MSSECKECDLALYCFSDSNSWIFRTKQEMEEKWAEMAQCPNHEKVQQKRSAGSTNTPSDHPSG